MAYFTNKTTSRRRQLMAEEAKSAPAVPAAEQAMHQAMKDPRVPKIYGNVFSIFINTHDVTVMVGVNNVPAGVVTMTYPFAKAFGQALVKAVKEYEKATGVSVSDPDALEAALGRQS